MNTTLTDAELTAAAEILANSIRDHGTLPRLEVMQSRLHDRGISVAIKRLSPLLAAAKAELNHREANRQREVESRKQRRAALADRQFALDYGAEDYTKDYDDQ